MICLNAQRYELIVTVSRPQVDAAIMQKLLRFLWVSKGAIPMYSHTSFMSLNCLLQGLIFLQTGLAVVPLCFTCFVAYQDVNRYDFGLSVMILLNQV